MTNKAMPRLVKVGFTLRDPEERAKELGNTGNPYPYDVEYAAIVDEPRKLETTVHWRLHEYREGKEWFCCTVIDAVREIRQAAKGTISSEIINGNLTKISIEESEEEWRTKKEEERLRRIREEKRIKRITAWRANVKEQANRQTLLISREEKKQIDEIERTSFFTAWIVTTLVIAVIPLISGAELSIAIMMPPFLAIWLSWIAQMKMDNMKGVEAKEKEIKKKFKVEKDILLAKFPHSVDDSELIFCEIEEPHIAVDAIVLEESDGLYYEGVIENRSDVKFRSIDIQISCKNNPAPFTVSIDTYLNAERQVPFSVPISVRPEEMICNISSAYGYQT